VRTRKPWIEAAQTPFRDDALMIAPPSCTAADFELPRLRRCPFDLDNLIIEASIDGGLDGYVWKVRFGDEGPFILKMVRGRLSFLLFFFGLVHGALVVCLLTLVF
jgi:hypothetical protein